MLTIKNLISEEKTMKKFMKKTLAVVLAIVMISATFVSFAAELNQDAVDAHYGQFKNYLLLGDSAASGYRDVMSDDDDAYNIAYNQSVYTIVPGSYADIIGKAIIGEEGKVSSFAAPGFRTIEVRYMLNDEYAAEVKDEPYLFHPSQLDVMGDYMGSEANRADFKAAVAAADLITLGVGGNDWGAYLTWVFADVLEEVNVADEYIQMAKEVLEKSTMDMNTLAQIVEIAHMAGALESLLTKLPSALEYGLTTFYVNWDKMIEDIYAVNDDVTLLVVGMSDNSIKGNYYSYNGVEGAPVNAEVAEEDATTADALKVIVSGIMAIANKPMIDGAAKFGYRYVDVDGTTYVDSHYDADGHVFVANKIIEALPDFATSKQYTDIAGHKYYDAIEYVLLNGIMQPAEDSKFAPDEALIGYELTAALNTLREKDKTSDNKKDVTAAKLAFELLGFTTTPNLGFNGLVKTIALALSVISNNNFNFGAVISRGEAADYLATLAKILAE
jgi:lysophospholipase L1-like esterase